MSNEKEIVLKEDCIKLGREHEWIFYSVITGYSSNDIEKAGYCDVCGYDTHGEYFK